MLDKVWFIYSNSQGVPLVSSGLSFESCALICPGFPLYAVLYCQNYYEKNTLKNALKSRPLLKR